MLLAREFVAYISRQIVKQLSPQWIETTDPQVAAAFIGNVVEEDLAVEDRLNDDVRDLLASMAITCGAKTSAIRRCSAASRTT